MWYDQVNVSPYAIHKSFNNLLTFYLLIHIKKYTISPSLCKYMSRPILCLCTYSRCFELLKLVSSFIAKNFIFTRLLKIHVDLLHTCSLNPKTRKPYKGLKSGVYKSEGVQKQKQEKKKKSKRTILIKERGSKISKTGLVHNGLGTPETTFSIVTTAEPTFTRSLSPSIPT